MLMPRRARHEDRGADETSRPAGRRGPRAALVLDVAVTAWCLLWIWMGVTIAQDIRGLERLSDTVASVGRAADETGAALQSFDGLPLVGDRLPETAAAVRAAGRSAAQSAQASRRSVRRTSVLLGVSIAAIPTLPALFAYLPGRLAARRERRRLSRLVRNGRDPVVDAQLALRAIANLPAEELRTISRDPGADFAAGRLQGLADAELARMRLGPVRPRGAVAGAPGP